MYNLLNPITNLNFTISIDFEVRWIIYNLQRKEVEVLIDEKLNSGYHYTKWNADSFSNSVYFAKIITRNFVDNNDIHWLIITLIISMQLTIIQFYRH